MMVMVSTTDISLVGAGMASAGRGGGRGRGCDTSTTIRVCLTGDLPHNFTGTNIEGGCRRHGGIKEHRVIDNLKFSQLMIFSAGSDHWAGFLLIFDNKNSFLVVATHKFLLFLTLSLITRNTSLDEVSSLTELGWGGGTELDRVVRRVLSYADTQRPARAATPPAGTGQTRHCPLIARSRHRPELTSQHTRWLGLG